VTKGRRDPPAGRPQKQRQSTLRAARSLPSGRAALQQAHRELSGRTQSRRRAGDTRRRPLGPLGRPIGSRARRGATGAASAAPEEGGEKTM